MYFARSVYVSDVHREGKEVVEICEWKLEWEWEVQLSSHKGHWQDIYLGLNNGTSRYLL